MLKLSILYFKLKSELNLYLIKINCDKGLPAHHSKAAMASDWLNRFCCICNCYEKVCMKEK